MPTAQIVAALIVALGGAAGLATVMRLLLRRREDSPVAAETERIEIKDDAALRSEMWGRIREVETECRQWIGKANAFATKVAALEADLRSMEIRDRAKSARIIDLESALAAERKANLALFADITELRRQIAMGEHSGRFNITPND